MPIHKFYPIFTLCFIFFLSVFFQPFSGHAQGNASSQFEDGERIDALLASMVPDKRTIGVFLTVAQQNEVPPQDWATTIQKYFKAYGFPVKIILDTKRPKGTGAAVLIYVGAQAYTGNLSSGDVGLKYFLTEHQEVFAGLLEMYKTANPDLFEEKDISEGG